MSLVRTLAVFAVITLVLSGLFAFTGSPPMSDEGKVIINVWHPWSAEIGEEFRRLVDVFNQTHDTIRVRLLYVPNNLSANQKLFLAISAGMPPDCTFIDGPQVCEWAARGAIEPLDAFMAKYDVHNEDFWGPCWRQNMFDGKTFALTYCADPNFAFFWNKAAFAEVGLPVDKPPRTLEELDQMARVLTKYDADKRIVRIGFIPWNVFGYSNSMFTWGWAFGGDFYDDASGRLTCGDDPHIFEAVDWMLSYSREYGFEKVNSFAEGFGDQGDNPFIRGKIAMAAGHVSNIKSFKKYAPDLDYGVCAFPYPAHMGFDHSAWMGGWCLGIPRGSRYPEEAFEFMKWLCQSKTSGESIIGTVGLFPGYMRSPAFEGVEQRDKLADFYTVLQNTRHQRPVMPAQAYFMGALERAVSHILNGVLPPKEALMDAQFDTQKELDRVMAQYRARVPQKK